MIMTTITNMEKGFRAAAVTDEPLTHFPKEKP